MRRVFGVKKEKAPPPTVEEANERLSKRGDTVDDKIRKLDAQLAVCRETIKRARGPAQDAAKRRALNLLKQKRMYEGQRDQLYSQSYNLEQVAFASEGLRDAQHTMAAMKSANKDLKGNMKALRIEDIDKLQDDMMDLMDYSNEVQETLGRSYGVPDDIDEEDLMGGPHDMIAEPAAVVVPAELDALEADMGSESAGVPSYLQPDSAAEESEMSLPPAPSSAAATQHHQAAQAEELELPAVPRASLRT
eukprot:SM000315S11894  [mRNA]  locus=s315:15388:17102:+ [translate_table: standard]